MLASGPGWEVFDNVCTAGPNDRPFVEIDSFFSIAVVVSGTFEFRARHGAAMLAPGALLLGNANREYECSHTHAAGDRCITFHYTPRHLDDMTDALHIDWPGFVTCRVPPRSDTVALTAEVVAAASRPADPLHMEELAMRLAQRAVNASTTSRRQEAQRPEDFERATLAVRQIERHYAERLTLSGLAEAAGISRFHFLRVFRDAVGTTPHRFLVRTRLSAAAATLRRTSDRIADVALACGFGDVSEFTRRFRAAFGKTPSVYAGRASKDVPSSARPTMDGRHARHATA